MIIETRKKVLKSGLVVTFSSAEVDDAEEFLSFMKQIYGESDYLLRYPEEFQLTEEDEIKYISSQRSADRMLLLTAKDESGRILGTAQAAPVSSAMKTYHRAECAVSVLKEYNGLGIGSELMKTLLMNIHGLGYTQLELEVIDGNIRAERLYQKLGFKRTGTTPNAFKLKDGRYLDLVKMVLGLNGY